MAQILIAPNKYIQGPGELANIAEHTGKLGKKAFCLISEGGMKRIKPQIDSSFEYSDAAIDYETFNGECSDNEIQRLVKECQARGNDVIIGVGGGKIHDTAKAAGFFSNLPVVIVPTIASTDAPCSALSVIYTDEGVFDRYLFLKQNPNVVLVDTQIIAQAPARLLVSGMGDALATYFEAKACLASNASTCAFGTSTMAAQALAELCYETLITEGYQAKLAAESDVSTKALEKIVEANTLLSGMGFESGGLAAAHAIHNGFTVLPETHNKYHGEKVAFGTLVQLVLEDASMDDLEEVLEFCSSVGLPVTLEELGVTGELKEKVRSVAKAAAVEGESIHNMPFPVTEDSVYAAILTADALGKEFV